MAEPTQESPSSPVPRLKCVPLGNVVAAYDRHSGRTHVLDPLTAAILEERWLHGIEADGEALSSAVAGRLGCDRNELLLQLVGESLARLRSAGLC